MIFKKFFTPQQANKRLPLVKEIVKEIIEKGKLIREKLNQPAADDALRQECAGLETEINVLMNELEELGCFYKDWNFTIGLVDFPAVLNGQKVFLCWRSDEPLVRWYHPIEEGYASRKLIPENLLEL